MDWLWIGSAFLLGWVGTGLGLPPMVGYLFAGILLSALGQEAGSTVEDLSSIGVLLLLFAVGLKLKVRSLFKWEILGVGGAHLLGFGAVLAGALAATGISVSPALFIGFSLTFSSTVLAVKMLEDRSELNALHGRIAVGVLIIQDIVAIGMLSSVGAKQPTLWALLLPLVFLLKPLLGWILDRSGHKELLLVFGIGIALCGGQLAKSVGISPEVGALLAGALIGSHEKAGELSKIVWSVKELFLVTFFLKMGLTGLPTVGQWWTVLAILAAIPLKALLFFTLLILFGLRARTAFVVTASLSTYSEFALITLAAGISGGLISASWAPILGTVVIISLVIGAPINHRVHDIFDRLERFLVRFERTRPHPDREPTKLGAAGWLVVGMGRTGGGVYKALEAQGAKVVGFDSDPEKASAHVKKGRRVVYADAEDPGLWSNVDLTRLQGIVLTLPDFEAKLIAVKAIRARGFEGVVAVTTYHKEEDEILQKAGASMIFHLFAAAGERLADTALAASAATRSRG